MSVIWVVCGAGRNVGKTTVALQLCEALPDSVYAKCGHGCAKADRPGEFFNTLDDLYSFIDAARTSEKHIVVESNAMAISGRGDISVFLDGVFGITDFRSDTERLREAAHIRISRDTNPAEWKRFLSARLGSTRICDDVCRVLLSQKRFLFGSTLNVRSKVWFEAAGNHIFGSGLACLLENVNRRGTLQEAAKASHMSYRYAWNLIRMAENHFGKSLLERHAGGQFGGCSKLSSDGLHVLTVFNQLNEQVASFADKKFAKLVLQEKINVRS